MRKIDLSGDIIGPFKVLERLPSKHKTSYWKCQCLHCGGTHNIARTNLISGIQQSCGCLKKIFGHKHYHFKGVGELTRSYLKRLYLHAKRRKLEVSVTTEYLWELFVKQNRLCAISGKELVMPTTKNNDVVGYGIASLDRIDCSKGYVEGNVQWVDKRINFMKHRLNQEEFIKLCLSVTNYQNQKSQL